MYSSTLPNITPITLPSEIPGEKPSDKPSIHQLQARTGLPSLVPPTFQVCTKAAEQAVVFIIFQSCILASTIMYHFNKIYMRPPVPISVPFYWNFHHSTLILILNQQTVVLKPIILVL